MTIKISSFNYLALFTIILGIQTVSSQPVKNISNFEAIDTNWPNETLVRTERGISISDPNFNRIVAIAAASFLCHVHEKTATNLKTEICRVNVKKLDPAHALIINPSDHTKFIYPDNKGDILFLQGENVFLSCADYENMFLLIPNVRYETFVCICDNVFYGRQEHYDFGSLRCKHMPKYDIVDKCEIKNVSSKTHGVTYHKFEIGFFTDDKPNFLKTLDIFYNDDKATTMYSKSIVSKSLAGGQAIATNLPFNPTHCCERKTVNINEVYDPQSQESSFQLQLPNQKHLPVDKRYLQKGTGYEFTRGHLTPPSSMVYTAAGASTFAYLNVIPEWKKVYQGNWIKIENHINELAKKLQRDLTVITGVTYTMALPDIIQLLVEDDYQYITINMKEMFLYAARLNRESFIEEYPIPSNLFKIVIDPVTNNGVVFVTLNNPHILYPIFQHLCFRAVLDMSRVTTPKNWQPANGSWGTSYMCKVQNFLQLSGIPFFENITAEELLYIPKPDSPVTYESFDARYYYLTSDERTTMSVPTTERTKFTVREGLK